MPASGLNALMINAECMIVKENFLYMFQCMPSIFRLFHVLTCFFFCVIIVKAISSPDDEEYRSKPEETRESHAMPLSLLFWRGAMLRKGR